jgi:hypothetical protein
MSPERKRRVHKGHDHLHGNAPDRSQVALLIDVINDLSFPDNKDLGPGEIDRQTEEAMQKVGYPDNLCQRQSGPMPF